MAEENEGACSCFVGMNAWLLWYICGKGVSGADW